VNPNVISGDAAEIQLERRVGAIGAMMGSDRLLPVEETAFVIAVYLGCLN
jgi:hypothetical protein